MSDAPKRIQLSRRKGWRLPPNTVVVARPGKWGNPFKVGGHYIVPDGPLKPGGGAQWLYLQVHVPDRRATSIETAAQAGELFRRLEVRRARGLSELRGKNLACWCKPGEPCHADVLLELANAPAGLRLRLV